MQQDNLYPRLDPEWVTLNALRDLIKLAVQGDKFKATYGKALDLGAVICPDILGEDVSILHQHREKDLTQEYRQKAKILSAQKQQEITALSLVQKDIAEQENLLEFATTMDKTRIDKLQRKLSSFYASEEELNPKKASENQLIFRDALKVDRSNFGPLLTEGRSHRVFELDHDNLLTIRVLHPEDAEKITGADLVYERYDESTKTVVVAFVQYKIWEKKKMYLSDTRMLKQLERMKKFLCGKGVCRCDEHQQYRFPCCSAFLRPTDKLQNPNQKFISTGEHLPICKIDNCLTKTPRGANILEYKNIKATSLSHEMFEKLFNQRKIGSKPLSLFELGELYKDSSIISDNDNRMLLYAQEYPKFV